MSDDYYKGYHETQVRYDYNKKNVVCSFCGEPDRIMYIATGHDHTDYNYRLCNCPEAVRTGKPAEECT